VSRRSRRNLTATKPPGNSLTSLQRPISSACPPVPEVIRCAANQLSAALSEFTGHQLPAAGGYRPAAFTTKSAQTARTRKISSSACSAPCIPQIVSRSIIGTKFNFTVGPKCPNMCPHHCRNQNARETAHAQFSNFKGLAQHSPTRSGKISLDANIVTATDGSPSAPSVFAPSQSHQEGGAKLRFNRRSSPTTETIQATVGACDPDHREFARPIQLVLGKVSKGDAQKFHSIAKLFPENCSDFL